MSQISKHSNPITNNLNQPSKASNKSTKVSLEKEKGNSFKLTIQSFYPELKKVLSYEVNNDTANNPKSPARLNILVDLFKIIESQTKARKKICSNLKIPAKDKESKTIDISRACSFAQKKIRDSFEIQTPENYKEEESFAIQTPLENAKKKKRELSNRSKEKKKASSANIHDWRTIDNIKQCPGAINFIKLFFTEGNKPNSQAQKLPAIIKELKNLTEKTFKSPLMKKLIGFSQNKNQIKSNIFAPFLLSPHEHKLCKSFPSGQSLEASSKLKSQVKNKLLASLALEQLVAKLHGNTYQKEAQAINTRSLIKKAVDTKAIKSEDLKNLASNTNQRNLLERYIDGTESYFKDATKTLWRTIPKLLLKIQEESQREPRFFKAS